jgi:YidC/Oxa1 family membrane protein insertase
MVNFFHTILSQPLFNGLIALYQYVPGHDLGVAIILLTLIIKFILYPLAAKGIQSQKALNQLQPKMKEIQERLKNNKEEQAKAVMALYKTEKVNPFSGFLTLIIQLPILWALFRVFINGFSEEKLSILYPFISNPGQINTSFLGIVDLSKASIVLAILTGVAQFIQSKMTVPSQPKKNQTGAPQFSNMMQKQMLYFLPLFTVFILWRMPAAVALYWLTTTIFTIVQQYIILKKHEPRIKEN